jgi:hypothetical protein
MRALAITTAAVVGGAVGMLAGVLLDMALYPHDTDGLLVLVGALVGALALGVLVGRLVPRSRRELERIAWTRTARTRPTQPPRRIDTERRPNQVIRRVDR